MGNIVLINPSGFDFQIMERNALRYLVPDQDGAWLCFSNQLRNDACLVLSIVGEFFGF
jgi:hypothetical protein